MLTTSKRPPNAKKSKQRQAKSTEHADINAFVKASRVEYDELVKQKARVTSTKKIADLDERVRVHADLSEVNALLKFNSEPVIANNVVFGRISGDEAVVRYGFTCTLSKRGDTSVVPVPINPEELSCMAYAKSMVKNGIVAQAYKTASRNFVAAEMERIEKERTKGIVSVLEAASLVENDADDMIEEAAAFRALMAAFGKLSA